MFQHRINLLAGHAGKNHSRKSSTVAPSSRFSNNAATGTRVPLNSHAPLTFPAVRSTAAHLLQSNMIKP
jgi:hypothetical protein